MHFDMKDSEYMLQSKKIIIMIINFWIRVCILIKTVNALFFFKRLSEAWLKKNGKTLKRFPTLEKKNIPMMHCGDHPGRPSSRSVVLPEWPHRRKHQVAITAPDH